MTVTGKKEADCRHLTVFVGNLSYKHNWWSFGIFSVPDNNRQFTFL